MRRVLAFGFFTLVLLAGAAHPTIAQEETAPDYSVFFVSRDIIADETELEAEFIVYNDGAAANEEAQAELREASSDTLLATVTVPPIPSDSSQPIILSFPLSTLGYTSEQQVVFELTITSDEIEAVSLLQSFSVPPAPEGAAPPPEQTPAEQPGLIPAIGPVDALFDLLPFDLNLSDRVQVAILATVIVVLILVIWLIVVILRLLFVRKPTFPPNPPPYAGMPYLNPDSLGGRRQQWQQVAQHGSMLAEETEGSLHARKLLMGMDNTRYSGWRVVGLRASQYDTYGRVARSQTLAPNGLLRRLNKVLDQAESLTTDAVERRVRPVARRMAAQLRGRMNHRSAALPIALDVKFRGIHGEVSIVFELYQYQVGAWRRLDRWQPDMTVTGKSIYEGYTYTLHGKSEDESMRQFQQRLRDDMTFLLTEMVLCSPPPTPPAQQPGQTGRLSTPTTAAPPTRTSGSGAPPTANAGMRPVPPVQEDEDTNNAPTVDDSDSMDTMIHGNKDY